jgi:hypothetical protein
VRRFLALRCLPPPSTSFGIEGEDVRYPGVLGLQKGLDSPRAPRFRNSARDGVLVRTRISCQRSDIFKKTAATAPATGPIARTTRAMAENTRARMRNRPSDRREFEAQGCGLPNPPHEAADPTPDTPDRPSAHLAHTPLGLKRGAHVQHAVAVDARARMRNRPTDRQEFEAQGYGLPHSPHETAGPTPDVHGPPPAHPAHTQLGPKRVAHVQHAVAVGACARMRNRPHDRREFEARDHSLLNSSHDTTDPKPETPNRRPTRPVRTPPDPERNERESGGWVKNAQSPERRTGPLATPRHPPRTPPRTRGTAPPPLHLPACSLIDHQTHALRTAQFLVFMYSLSPSPSPCLSPDRPTDVCPSHSGSPGARGRSPSGRPADSIPGSAVRRDIPGKIKRQRLRLIHRLGDGFKQQ